MTVTSGTPTNVAGVADADVQRVDAPGGSTLNRAAGWLQSGLWLT